MDNSFAHMQSAAQAEPIADVHNLMVRRRLQIVPRESIWQHIVLFRLQAIYPFLLNALTCSLVLCKL